MLREPHPDTFSVPHWLLVSMALGAIWLSLAAPIRAATPDSSPPPVLIDPLDPRTGEEASLVGAPLLAAVIVIGTGAAAVVGTYAYVRLAGRRKRPR